MLGWYTCMVSLCIWMMLTLFFGCCDTFLHSHLFPGNQSQLGRMLTYCTLHPTSHTLTMMMMMLVITNAVRAVILLSLMFTSKAIDVDDHINTTLLLRF